MAERKEDFVVEKQVRREPRLGGWLVAPESRRERREGERKVDDVVVGEPV
jgi:hypothetical protein